MNEPGELAGVRSFYFHQYKIIRITATVDSQNISPYEDSDIPENDPLGHLTSLFSGLRLGLNERDFLSLLNKLVLQMMAATHPDRARGSAANKAYLALNAAKVELENTSIDPASRLHALAGLRRTEQLVRLRLLEDQVSVTKERNRRLEVELQQALQDRDRWRSAARSVEERRKAPLSRDAITVPKDG